MDGGFVDPAFLLLSLLDEDRLSLDAVFDPALFVFSYVRSGAARRVSVSIPAIVLWPLLGIGLRLALPRIRDPCVTLLRGLRQSLRYATYPLRRRPDLCLIYHLISCRAFEPALIFLLFL